MLGVIDTHVEDIITTEDLVYVYNYGELFIERLERVWLE